MKVIGINGSPNKEGNTWHALRTVGRRLEENGIEFEIIHIGNKAIHGCIACGKCRINQDGLCSIKNDGLNDFLPILSRADGIVLGSPVYFSGVAGTMKSFLDRLFYVSLSNGNFFRHKTGAALVTVRRTGGSSTLDCLNHYLTYSEMQLAGGNYWTVTHGRTPGEVLQDAEGIQTLEVMADNMAWQMKMRKASENLVESPEARQKVMTSFIR
jgi:multimeric flavodoxin WrbA